MVIGSAAIALQNSDLKRSKLLNDFPRSRAAMCSGSRGWPACLGGCGHPWAGWAGAGRKACRFSAGARSRRRHPGRSSRPRRARPCFSGRRGSGRPSGPRHPGRFRAGSGLRRQRRGRRARGRYPCARFSGLLCQWGTDRIPLPLGEGLGEGSSAAAPMSDPGTAAGFADPSP